MLFVSTILSAAGYTLLYAAVKGDSYTVGGVPVWRRPWLPFVDIFSGRVLTGGTGPQIDNKAPGDSLAAAFSGVGSNATLAGQSTAGLANPQFVTGAGPTDQIPPGSIVR